MPTKQALKHCFFAYVPRATGVPSYLEALQPILCGPDLRSRGHAPFLFPQLPSPLTDVDQLPSSASQYTLSLTAAAALSQVLQSGGVFGGEY